MKIYTTEQPAEALEILNNPKLRPPLKMARAYDRLAFYSEAFRNNILQLTDAEYSLYVEADKMWPYLNEKLDYNKGIEALKAYAELRLKAA